MPSTTNVPANPNRRRFLGAAMATAASYKRVLGANDTIRVGAIGTGARWGQLFDSLQKNTGNQVVAVCDVYEPRRLSAKAQAAAGATDHVDYREILDNKSVDAVMIATPDHWHVRIAIDAVKAGKDVYCEKPVTHTPAEAEPLLAAVHGSNRVVQIGLQQRSWEHYLAVKKNVIDAGVLGQVTMIRTYWYQNHQVAGRVPTFDTSKLDWKRFLGSATDRPFDADTFANWRWYWDFGGGAMTDLFVHWVDVAQWFMGVDMPTRATATGVKALLQRRQTPDTMSAALSYPAAVVEFDCALLGYIEGGGLMFRGTKGAMRLHRQGYEVYNEIPNYSEAFQPPPAASKGKSSRDGLIDHVQNFLDCVRSRATPNAPVEVGVAAARAGHIANIAMRGSGVWTPDMKV